MQADIVLKKMDDIVDAYARRTKIQAQPITKGRAIMFVKQHRLNTRQRNSVLKLRVATNCTDWDTKLKIIKACSQEIVADNEFGGGKAHWEIIEELGQALGLSLAEIRAEKPIPTTELAWAAWNGLMANTHWLEGIVANTCAERVNVPGYGVGEMRDHGWSWVQRKQWAKTFGLSESQLAFFKVHEEADLDHSNMGWKAVADFAEKYGMEEQAVHACEINLHVWEMYFNGIADAGDRLQA